MGRGCKGNCEKGASGLLVRFDRMALANGCDVKASAFGKVLFLARSSS